MKFKVMRADGTYDFEEKYLVVNIIEPYAGKVADMIEAEERRKGTWDHGEKTMREVMGIKDVYSQPGKAKIHIKNQLGGKIKFCAGTKEYELDPEHEITIEVNDGDCLYFDHYESAGTGSEQGGQVVSKEDSI